MSWRISVVSSEIPRDELPAAEMHQRDVALIVNPLSLPSYLSCFLVVCFSDGVPLQSADRRFETVTGTKGRPRPLAGALALASPL